MADTAHVTVVDRHNLQTFLPLLYQVSTEGLAADHVAHPIRGAPRKTGVQFRMGSSISVDHNNRTCKLDSSDVYLYGEISNWQFSPAFKMNYIDECGCYQKTLLCKQGYYNYLYFVKENEPISYSPLLIEGSHFETNNNYQLFFYTSDINSRYDHLSGYLNTDN